MRDPDDIAARSERRRLTASVARFASLEEENEAERRRRARLTTEQRLAEAAAIRERACGQDWATRPIEKVWSLELVDWL